MMVSGERDDDGVEGGAVTVANPSHSIPLSPIQLPSHIHTSTLSIPLDRANSTHSDDSLSLSITPTHIEHGSSFTLSEDSQRLSPSPSLSHPVYTTQPHSSSSIACSTHVDEGKEGCVQDQTRRGHQDGYSHQPPSLPLPTVAKHQTRAASISNATSNTQTHGIPTRTRSHTQSDGSANAVVSNIGEYVPLNEAAIQALSPTSPDTSLSSLNLPWVMTVTSGWDTEHNSEGTKQ